MRSDSYRGSDVINLSQCRVTEPCLTSSACAAASIDVAPRMRAQLNIGMSKGASCRCPQPTHIRLTSFWPLVHGLLILPKDQGGLLALDDVEIRPEQRQHRLRRSPISGVVRPHRTSSSARLIRPRLHRPQATYSSMESFQDFGVDLIDLSTRRCKPLTTVMAKIGAPLTVVETRSPRQLVRIKRRQRFNMGGVADVAAGQFQLIRQQMARHCRGTLNVHREPLTRGVTPPAGSSARGLLYGEIIP